LYIYFGQLGSNIIFYLLVLSGSGESCCRRSFPYRSKLILPIHFRPLAAMLGQRTSTRALPHVFLGASIIKIRRKIGDERNVGLGKFDYQITRRSAAARRCTVATGQDAPVASIDFAFESSESAPRGFHAQFGQGKTKVYVVSAPMGYRTGSKLVPGQQTSVGYDPVRCTTVVCKVGKDFCHDRKSEVR